MRIDVTAEHIARGRQNSSRACPIALAVRSVGQQYTFALVWANCIYIPGKEIKLPEEAAHFVTRYDQDLSVEPFSFEVDL